MVPLIREDALSADSLRFPPLGFPVPRRRHYFSVMRCSCAPPRRGRC